MEPNNLFHTPENWDELASWIERHSPDDRPHLYTAAFMMWNLACKEAQKETTDETQH